MQNTRRKVPWKPGGPGSSIQGDYKLLETPIRSPCLTCGTKKLIGE